MVAEQSPIPSKQDSDEYELVPRSQIEYLQREVEKLRKNPFGDTGSAKDMIGQVDSLNKNIAKLINIFETANDEIVRDYKDKANTEKISLVLEQNEKLAKGIVAIADLLKELKTMRTETWPQPAQPSGATAMPAELAPSSYSSSSLSPEWQSVMHAQGQGAPAQGANPFLEQGYAQQPGMMPPGPAPGQQFSAPSQFSAPQAQQGQPRKLPPIDFSAVPPPPPRR